MRLFFRHTVNIVSVLIILAFIAYGVLWAVVAHEMQKHLDNVWDNQEKFLLVISGEKPRVTGFPAPPRLIFAGSITDRNGMVYAAPELVYQCFPLPTQSMTLSAPQGLEFSGPVLKLPVRLDDFQLRIRIPRDFPGRYDAATLQSWRQRGGNLPVENLRIVRASLTLNGEGYLQLDQDLQPEGSLTARLSGLDDLLQEFTANGMISDKQALMAQSLINLMSQKDAETGANTLTTGIRIQQGGVFLGPLRIASLPEWRWSGENKIEP